MSWFVVRLLPPRPSFLHDASEAERAVMGTHAGYWRRLAAEGKAVVFGPVDDPAGSWGLGVLHVADHAEADALLAADPAITGGIGLRAEMLPMAAAIVGRITS